MGHGQLGDIAYKTDIDDFGIKLKSALLAID
jgi:hypothetical protein